MPAPRMPIENLHADGTACTHRLRPSGKPTEPGCTGRAGIRASCTHCGETEHDTVKESLRLRIAAHLDHHRHTDVTPGPELRAYLTRHQVKMSGGRWLARQTGNGWLVGLVVDLTEASLVNLRFVHPAPRGGGAVDSNIYLGGADNFAPAVEAEVPPAARAAIRSKAKALAASLDQGASAT